jgi:hypothetical protein
MNNLLDTQAQTMLSLQYGMNAKVDPEWVAARYPYLRAVVIEGAEAIEHHGWKWWKHQQHDLSQLQMELIDIWHFMLSDMLLACDGDQTQATGMLIETLSDESDNSLIFDGKTYHLNQLDLVAKLELLIGTSVARRTEVSLFEAIMRDCQMDWDGLYRQYVGKNVLNFFRQDHGYKQGTYRKLWNGREDNEHLVEVLESLDTHADDFQGLLYQALQERYQASE